jgi:UPF0755 protein
MKYKIIYPVMLIAIFLIALLVNLVFFNRTFRNSNTEITIHITMGDNLRSIARVLEDSGVIYNKGIFELTGRVFGYQNRIIAGEYKFRNGLTNFDVLKEITDVERNRSVTITIPEGMNIRQIGRLLQRLYGLDSAGFVRATYNDSLIALLGINAENLEGYLFPDTYEFNFSASDNREGIIVHRMADQFRNKLTDSLLTYIDVKKLNLKDIITVASIVEGETRYEPEKKTIAGVYYNRLKKRMKLEADPTVQYALPNGPKRVLTYSDLKIVSPYNTYLKRGLPPGPINNPGMGSIMAAIEPENNKYLYFVAKGDGSHRFAQTYEEHKKNIKEYKLFLQEQEKKKQENNK